MTTKTRRRKGKKRMTAKQRVLARYPSAQAIENDLFVIYAVYHGPHGRGMQKPLSKKWHKTRRAAWADAARRLP